MVVNISDFSRAINASWDASTLDTTFKALWSDPTEDEFLVLNDQEASPDQPWPYVVLDQPSQNTTDRMSSEGAAIREVRDVELRFNIHAKQIDGDSRTAKEIAADMAEAIMKVFGGHPIDSPSAVIVLTSGNHLITRLDNDFGVRTGDKEYQHVLVYLFRLDVPVAV